MGTVGAGDLLRFEGEGERLAVFRGEFAESSWRALPGGTLGSGDIGVCFPISFIRVGMLDCSDVPASGPADISIANGAMRFLGSPRFVISR